MVEFTDSSFKQDVLDSDLPVLVDFYADWCGPCKMLAPTLEKLATEYAGRVTIGKLNADGSAKALEYKVSSIPCMMLFKGGEVVGTITGLMKEADLKAKLEDLLF